MKKISWGWKIVALYSGFVVLILFMVFKSISQEFHMVRQDYYGAEMEHETHMIKVRNSQKLVQRLQVNQEATAIQLVFPTHMEGISGTVTLYRPSDAKLDQSFEIKPGEANTQAIPTEGLRAGKWLVRVDWTDGVRDYFDEKMLVL